VSTEDWNAKHQLAKAKSGTYLAGTNIVPGH